MFEKIKESVSNFFRGIVDKFKQLIERIRSHVSRIVEFIRSLVRKGG